MIVITNQENRDMEKMSIYEKKCQFLISEKSHLRMSNKLIVKIRK